VRSHRRSARGHVFQVGRIWYVSYWHRGRRVRQSSGSTSRAVAARLLAGSLALLRPGRGADETRLHELLAARAARFDLDRRRSAPRLRISHAHLLRHFGAVLAADIDSASVTAYATARAASGVAPGTINAELSALRAALRAGVDEGRLQVLPRVKLLPKPAPRHGFVTTDQLGQILARLPLVVRRIVIVAFWTGMRTASEILPMEWESVDPEGKWLYLWTGTTKTGAARAVPTTKAVRLVLAAQREEADHFFKHTGRRPETIFFRGLGQPYTSIRYRWNKAVREAGLPGLHIHDLRRSAAQRLAAANIPRTIAQKMLGHSSPAVHDSYALPEGRTLLEAAATLDEMEGVPHAD
jgi:integrase